LGYFGINKAPYYQQSGVMSRHPGGANFALADGHVTFFNETINQQTLKALTTRNGGEVIDGTDY